MKRFVLFLKILGSLAAAAAILLGLLIVRIKNPSDLDLVSRFGGHRLPDVNDREGVHRVYHFHTDPERIYQALKEEFSGNRWHLFVPKAAARGRNRIAQFSISDTGETIQFSTGDTIGYSRNDGATCEIVMNTMF